MTSAEQRAWDAKIRALKHAGVGMPERVERARRELAAEAAARAEPETPTPPAAEPRLTPVTEESAGRTRKRKPVRKTNQETAASRNTEDKRTMNAEPRAVPLKLTRQGNSTAPEPEAPTSKQDQQSVESSLPEVIDAVRAAPHFRVTVRTWRRWDSAGRIPPGFKIGGRKLWRATDLESWANWGFPSRADFTARLRTEESAREAHGT